MIPWLGKSKVELHEDLTHLDSVYGIRFYRAMNHEAFCYNIVLRVYKFDAPTDNFSSYMLGMASESDIHDPFILWFSDINDLATFESNELFHEYVVDYGRGLDYGLTQTRIHCNRWQDVLNRMILDKLTNEPEQTSYSIYGMMNRSVGPRIEVILKEPLR